MNRFFSFDGEVFETHDTPAAAKAGAEAAVESYRDESGDGWSEEAGQVCWGEINQHSTQCDVRTREDVVADGDDDELEEMDAEGWSFMCDYQLADVDPPGEDDEPTSKQQLASIEIWTVERHVDHEFGEVRDVVRSKEAALDAAEGIRVEINPDGDWSEVRSEDGSVSWELRTSIVSVGRWKL